MVSEARQLELEPVLGDDCTAHPRSAPVGRRRLVLALAVATALLYVAVCLLRGLAAKRPPSPPPALPYRRCAALVTSGAQRDDTAALQRLLDDPTCAEVVLPSGATLRATQLFVRRSHVTLTLEPNATLAGLPAAFRAARPECATEEGLEFDWTRWCALLRVTAAANFTLRGSGTLSPGGGGGSAPDFLSALHVRSTSLVALSGVRVHCTAWWWCTVLHNATDVTLSRVFIDGRAGRDGLDLVNCRRVLIEDSRIEGSDDALCFKTISNRGLGAHGARDVLVRNVDVGSVWCNAIQFGSATEVDIANVTFRDVRIGFARKAAISVISMDGANVSQLRFENVRIEGEDVATPLFVKVGNRVACEDQKGTCWRPGSIGDVNLTNVTAVGWGNAHPVRPGHRHAYTATIEGLNASHGRVGPLRFDRLTLVSPGRGVAAHARLDPPREPLRYQPRYDGVRPAHGLFVRYARDVDLVSSSVGVTAEDGRPAIVIDEVAGFRMARVDLSGGGPCQVEARHSSGDWSDGGHVRACDWSPDPRPAGRDLGRAYD